MATFHFRNAYWMCNTVDLSDHVQSIELTDSNDLLDDTCMGDTYRSRIAGMMDWRFTVTLTQDYAASKVDQTIHGLIGAAATTQVIKPDSGAVAATNPSFTGSAIPESYSPITGTVGDLGVTTITFVGAGTLVRAEA